MVIDCDPCWPPTPASRGRSRCCCWAAAGSPLVMAIGRARLAAARAGLSAGGGSGWCKNDPRRWSGGRLAWRVASRPFSPPSCWSGAWAARPGQTGCRPGTVCRRARRRCRPARRRRPERYATRTPACGRRSWPRAWTGSCGGRSWVTSCSSATSPTPAGRRAERRTGPSWRWVPGSPRPADPHRPRLRATGRPVRLRIRRLVPLPGQHAQPPAGARRRTAAAPRPPPADGPGLPRLGLPARADLAVPEIGRAHV